MKTVFSGIKPTGNLGLGNYLGAFRNWKNMQDDNKCIFSVVDLHALTVRNDPIVLREQTKEIIMLYIASGIDPEKSIIYCQSHVSAHANLGWVLGCYTYMGELNRMTQFKEKSENSDNINAGLFTYPVLMASDILLYNTDIVPVGEDQIQHVELTRNIAERFNNVYGDIFTIPEAVMSNKMTARIKGLQNPEKKMSKTEEDPNDGIFLLDDPKTIIKKIKKAVTDSDTSVYFDKENKPGVSNLLSIYAAITNKTIEQSEKDFSGVSYGPFKQAVADALVAEIEPMQQEYYRLKADSDYIENIMKKNSKKASEIADKTLYKVYNAIGLVPKSI